MSTTSSRASARLNARRRSSPDSSALRLMSETTRSKAPRSARASASSGEWASSIWRSGARSSSSMKRQVSRSSSTTRILGMAGLGAGARDGEADLDLRAFVAAAGHGDGASVRGHHVARDGEAETRALAGLLRGEEGVEDAGHVAGVDAAAGVRDRDLDQAAARAHRHQQLPSAGHGVDAVGDEVEEDLLE